ncbi:ankyrin repeat domain-containing protein [Paenibacillus sp. FSL R7-0652]|uniref:ankyrin repeat domain-containing protein n=1 Tax=Paenibacillus sp. FSL R7-0652 TaxID=2921687 RepID=UPI00315AAD98
MYKIGNQGTFKTLPDEALAIYQGNTEGVEACLEHGMDLEEKIVLSRHTELSPLHLALICNQPKVVRLLVERGAALNAKENPAILYAVRYCGADVIRYLHEQGARLEGVNHVKSNAYDEAYNGNKKNIKVLHELGLDIRKYGGGTLRKAVSDYDMKTVQYLLQEGVDINYNEPDMVYPYKATPLTTAARQNNMRMVQYLVEQGADVTIQEKDGERAYTIAVSQKNTEMAAYLKAHEPEQFHNRSNKLHALKSYKLPASVIQFLTEGPHRIELPEHPAGVRHIEFFSLTDTVEMKMGRQKLLRLSSDLDQYSHILIVWNPSRKMIGYADIEHQEHGTLCTFEQFLAAPAVYVKQILE